MRLRQRVDPTGLFLNDYLRRHLVGPEKKPADRARPLAPAKL